MLRPGRSPASNIVKTSDAMTCITWKIWLAWRLGEQDERPDSTMRTIVACRVPPCLPPPLPPVQRPSPRPDIQFRPYGLAIYAAFGPQRCFQAPQKAAILLGMYSVTFLVRDACFRYPSRLPDYCQCGLIDDVRLGEHAKSIRLDPVFPACYDKGLPHHFGAE